MASTTYQKDNYHAQNFVRVVNPDGTDVTFSSGGASASNIQGNIGSGSTDSGSPVKVGGVYNTTQPTVTNGQRVDAQYTNRGEAKVALFDGAGGANPIATSTVNVDAQAAGQTSLVVTTRAQLFNGSTWDRQRDATSANATTGTGVLAAGAMGKYNSTLPTYTDGQFGNLQIGSRGSLNVTLFGVGNSTAITAGAPSSDAVAIGSINGLDVRSTSSLLNGVSYDRSRSIQGALGDNTGLGVQAVASAGAKFSNITTATTTTVKSGGGILHGITVNTPVASATITLYDNTTATGTKIATITLPSTITGESPFRLMYDVAFATGLTVVTSGATDITISYR